MNSAGADFPHILNDFVDTDTEIHDIIRQFNFDEWYPHIKDTICTPTSFIVKMSDNVDNIINSLPNKECFARLDILSAKPLTPYKNTKEILEHIYSEHRTYSEITDNTKLIIREWLYNLKNEFRCYVHDTKLRAVSCDFSCKIITNVLKEIRKYVNDIIKLCEYDDFSVDFAFHNNKLILIEINTPVYLCATSGNFDLSNTYDYEILLGDYIPDIISYPIIR